MYATGDAGKERVHELNKQWASEYLSTDKWPSDPNLSVHAEMKALCVELYDGRWMLEKGVIRRSSGAKKVPSTSFTTKEPHCIACTYMLHTLDLPLTLPSMNRFQEVGNGVSAYGLPSFLRYDPYVVCKAFTGTHDLKNLHKLLNDRFGVDGKEWHLTIKGKPVSDMKGESVEWSEFVTGTIDKSSRVDQLWATMWDWFKDNAQ